MIEYPYPHSEISMREFFVDTKGRMWYASSVNNKIGYFYLTDARTEIAVAAILIQPPADATILARSTGKHQSRLTPLALMISAHCAISATRNFLR